MRKVLSLYFGVLVIVTLVFLISNPKLLSGLSWSELGKLGHLKNLPALEKLNREVNLPGPLTGRQDVPSAYLTKNGIILWTNIMRKQAGLSPLSEDSLLNQSAQNKLNDMFANQYFAHDSPGGVVLSDLVANVGYAYITIGENLALGNFADDKALVQGWMDSPGHRANILKSSYEEIGVAVGQQLYEGRLTWMAVQHFGRPLSSCPTPDTNLKAQIDQKTTQAETLRNEIETRRRELESSKPKSPEEQEEYNRKVDEYNSKVREYNALISDIENLVNTYNAQIASFNGCANG